MKRMESVSSGPAVEAGQALATPSGESPVMQRLEFEALQWQVAQWSGEETAQERQAFDHWLASSPAHRQAWAKVQELGHALRAAPEFVAGKVLRSGLSLNRRRRSVLRGIFWLSGASAVAYAARQTPQWTALAADYSTARGEYKDLTLPEGTRVWLNTASAVNLRYSDSERRLRMLAGEVLIATAPDDAPVPRPFIVQTSEGRIRALGTKFLVRSIEGGAFPQISVQVFEGAVEITPDAGAPPLRVDAGSQARFTRHEAQEHEAADPHAAAWHRGMLVAERMRLEDFLAELGRHRPGVLRCDPAVAHFLVSGVFPLQDTDVVLASLAQALPVSVRSRTRYWVTVAAR